jgi:Amt family ammonium transporter
VNGLKRLLKADDTLDVFGIHGVGGIVGGVLTGVFNAKPLGGPGLESLADIPHQLWLQVEGMIIAGVISAVVAFIGLKVAGALCGGVRTDADNERQGLDITSHGEQAYQK